VAQKFREQQELERRRHIEELRFRDEDKRSQVEERRKAIENAEQERRDALLKKNQVHKYLILGLPWQCGRGIKLKIRGSRV